MNNDSTDDAECLVNVRVEFDINVKKATASELVASGKEALKREGFGYPPRRDFLAARQWTAKSAAHLALGVDPLGSLRDCDRAAIAPAVENLERLFLATVGDSAPPADWLTTFRTLGIDSPWPTDPPETDTHQNPMDARTAALAAWLKAQGIPRADWHRLKTRRGLSRKKLYHALKDHPAFIARETGQPISETSFIAHFWKQQGIAALE
ncbi:hypothetical protein [Thiorhodovibrio frisius]|uniref:Uncharacterized protein n=1 Tax=Thiorhodovibrio frisius TaxID=631362 RepID=H8Z720_9GAMM|nr:hypothetical protein [Thiorhodovibrio frisius]EIC20819.1 hypothetical protein Thi970DRAFT_04483 [Thiorhodovibrio frisius]WPL21871.1 hypothetical protein Thiofri_02008 [Thiorhodovibrio frisius]